jgi:hypothetical protein
MKSPLIKFGFVFINDAHLGVTIRIIKRNRDTEILEGRPIFSEGKNVKFWKRIALPKY